MNNPRHAKAGFSLVEITLALLIAAVGLLATYSLFPAGLQMSKRTMDDVRAEEFTDSTFAGFRGLAIQTLTTQSAWTSFPGGAKPAQSETYMWDGDVLDGLRPNADNTIHVNQYKRSNVVYHELQYKLQIAPLPGHPNIKYMRVVIWPGAYGSQQEKDANIFYTEIYNDQMN